MTKWIGYIAYYKELFLNLGLIYQLFIFYVLLFSFYCIYLIRKKKFWPSVEVVWKQLASVKLTLVVLGGMLLLSIPGTVVLQKNISNLDPGLEYSYDFWQFGQWIQLFTAYQSFWYVALIVLLATNLIVCSYERWPGMWKLATMKPKSWGVERFKKQPKDRLYSWKTELSSEDVEGKLAVLLKQKWLKPVKMQDAQGGVQYFWQSGKWSRIANYGVHTSLLLIFLGGIVSALYGFEGAVNIPEGEAVDSFVLFKEGPLANLEKAPSPIPNEKLLGFRIYNENFDVTFYEDFPGRPKGFVSNLNIIKDGDVKKKSEIRVNYPMEYDRFTIYQSSYGRTQNFRYQILVLDKKKYKEEQPIALEAKLGEISELEKYKVKLVAQQAHSNFMDLGPAVQFQEFRGQKPTGEPFWVLKEHVMFDIENRKSPYGIVLHELEEIYFTGLQVGNDPGAKIYWIGCIGMVIGTLYALFITHRKYYLRINGQDIMFTGTVSRLPLGFDKHLQNFAKQLKGELSS